MIVNVPTKKDFKDLIRLYKVLGYNVSLELSDWDVYEDQTCVNINAREIDEYSKTVFYKQKGDLIWSFEEFKEDLIDGDLLGFPLEVVIAMLHQQKRQTGKTNLMTFVENKSCSAEGGGFDWSLTRQGYDYWDSVVYNEEFEEFNYNKSIL